MATTSAAPSNRWWEVCAKAVALDLPASLLEFPSWLFSEGETRRISVGPSVAKATVGTGWTGRVLLDALSPQLDLDSAALVGLMDHAMEGPLWLDVSSRGASLEGSMFSWPGGVEAWCSAVKPAAETLIGPLKAQRKLSGVADILTNGHLVGTVLSVAPELRLSAVFQVVGGVGSGDIDFSALGSIAGLKESDVALAKHWSDHFSNAGVRVLDVVVPALGSGGVELRWWNPGSEAARTFLSDVGAEGDALDRAEQLLRHSGRSDVARAVLDIRSSGRTWPRLVFVMGLATY